MHFILKFSEILSKSVILIQNLVAVTDCQDPPIQRNRHGSTRLPPEDGCCNERQEDWHRVRTNAHCHRAAEDHTCERLSSGWAWRLVGLAVELSRLRVLRSSSAYGMHGCWEWQQDGSKKAARRRDGWQQEGGGAVVGWRRVPDAICRPSLASKTGSVTHTHTLLSGKCQCLCLCLCLCQALTNID